MLQAIAKFDSFNEKQASTGGTVRKPAEKKAPRN